VSTRRKPGRVLGLHEAPPRLWREELPLAISKEQGKQSTRCRSREVEEVSIIGWSREYVEGGGGRQRRITKEKQKGGQIGTHRTKPSKARSHK